MVDADPSGQSVPAAVMGKTTPSERIGVEINPVLTEPEREIVNQAISRMSEAYYSDTQVIGLKAGKTGEGRMGVVNKTPRSFGSRAFTREFRFAYNRGSDMSIHHVGTRLRQVFEPQDVHEDFRVVRTDGDIFDADLRLYGKGNLRVFPTEYPADQGRVEYSLMMGGFLSHVGERG